jgi:hypothetical protein
MLIVASVFGYAQWRRQWLKAEVQKLNAEADPAIPRPIPFNDDWFWPTIPTEGAGVAIRRDRHGTLFANGKEVTVDEAKTYLFEKAKRLRKIGMQHVVYCILTPDNRGEYRTRTLKSLSELDAE